MPQTIIIVKGKNNNEQKITKEKKNTNTAIDDDMMWLEELLDDEDETATTKNTKAKASQKLNLDDSTFNNDKYNSFELQCQLRELTRSADEQFAFTVDRHKYLIKRLNEVNKSLPEIHNFHSWESNKVEEVLEHPVDVQTVKKAKDTLEFVCHLLKSYDKSEKKKMMQETYIKDINLSTFTRTKTREAIARDAIWEYVILNGLEDTFTQNNYLMDVALNNWFNLEAHKEVLLRLSKEKGRAYMQPVKRARRAVEAALNAD